MTIETLANQLGLIENDPWDHRSDTEKKQAAARQKLEDKLTQLFESSVPPPFVDPPDDADMTVATATRLLYRLTIEGEKLSAVYAVEPGLRDIALGSRNNASGCWVAVNSRHVAERLLGALQAHQMAVSLQQVGADGQPKTAIRTEAEYDALMKLLNETR